MKRRTLLVLVLAFVLAVAVLPAQVSAPWFGTHYQPGNVAFSLGAGLGFGGGFGISLYPGAEIIFAKVRPADVFSIDFGAGVKGAFSSWTYGVSPSYGFMTLGAAPFVSAHFGLRGFSGGELANYLERLDFFTAFGLGYQTFIPTGSWGSIAEPTGGLAFANFSGLNYFLTESIAITVNTNYFYGWNSSVSAGAFSTGIGVVFKIGPAEEIGERAVFEIPDVDAMTGNLMYANFAALYWTSVALGGYMPSDDTFEVGDGIRVWHRYWSDDEDDVEEIEFTRALLHENADGAKWWRFEFFVDDEELPFEALVNSENEIEIMRFIDPATDEVGSFVPRDTSIWNAYEEEEFWSSEELSDMQVGTERVRVPAGTFQTERYESSEDEYTYTWWLSDEVPGRVVKFEGVSQQTENVSSELLEVNSGVTTPWSIPW